MGAHSLTKYVQTDRSLHETWEDIYGDARSLHGTDSYSGSFATCNSVMRVADPMGLSDAETVAYAMFSEMQIPPYLRDKMLASVADASGNLLVLPRKWSSAFAIPVYSRKDATIKSKTVSLKHDLCGYLSEDRLLPLLRECVDSPRYAWIDNVSILGDSVRYRNEVEKFQGKYTTQWVLMDGNARNMLDDKRFNSEREAILAAREECIEQTSRGRSSGPVVHVVSLRHRGATPTKVSVSQVSRKTKVSFDVCTTKSGATDGWFVFGLAAS